MGKPRLCSKIGLSLRRDRPLSNAYRRSDRPRYNVIALHRALPSLNHLKILTRKAVKLLKMRLLLLTTILAVVNIQVFALSDNSTACPTLANLNLGNGTRVTLATSVPACSNFTGNSTETSYNTLQINLPSLCRVAFTVRTSSNSTAQSEVWLPQPSSWNNRFLAVGNGGFAGGVNYPDVVWGARKGFATMSTNTGHDSTQSDGTWMLNHPEALIDFGHRALHVTTGVAKRILKAYYGGKEGHAYYAGCSTGMSTM